MSIISELKNQIASLNRQIDQIQSECQHPKSVLKEEHGANTGNYDPGADCYWTTYTCGLCEKRWTQDHDKD